MSLKGFATGLLFLLLLPVCWQAGAAVPVVRVVGPAPVAGQVEALLAARASGIEIRHDDVPARLVVAVGARAFRDALEDPDATRVVGVALTRQAWRQVLASAPPARNRTGPTALFWDPDPVRQLRLAHVLFPGARSAGLVLGAPDDALTDALRREATRLGLDLVVGVVGPDESLSRQLNAVLADSDFLLGVEDPRVFSPELAKTVLLTSYRHGKPVIGPGQSYVTAGSVASLVTALPAMADELAAWLPALLAGEPAPPRYLDRYTVATNPQVARSLQLSLPSAQRLEAWLRGEEDSP